MLNNTTSYNTIIAGVIGSGKSYTEKKIIDALMSESNVMFGFIDPKKVELIRYKNNPKTQFYANDAQSIYEALTDVYYIMEERLERAGENGKTETDAPHLFVFVDEMAFLMQSEHKKEYVRIMNEIILIGRAAHIHLLLCTQVATQDVIPACIRDNMINTVCLRQRDAGKYRYLLGTFPGRLPMIGYAYVFTPNMERPEKVKTDDVWSKIAG